MSQIGLHYYNSTSSPGVNITANIYHFHNFSFGFYHKDNLLKSECKENIRRNARACVRACVRVCVWVMPPVSPVSCCRRSEVSHSGGDTDIGDPVRCPLSDTSSLTRHGQCHHSHVTDNVTNASRVMGSVTFAAPTFLSSRRHRP